MTVTANTDTESNLNVQSGRKILVLRAYPREEGFTKYITDWVVHGAVSAGAQVDNIDLRKLSIKSCLGCYSCWLTTPGVCVHKDDMEPLLQKILDSHIILCATPLYHFGMSSSLKKFFERTFPLLKPGIKQTSSGALRNSIRYPAQWNKKLGFISAGALRDPSSFDALKQSFYLLADGMDLELCAELIRPESYLLSFTLSKPKTLKTIETGLISAGRELAIDGLVSAKSEKMISLPLSADDQHFKEYSDIYWEHAMRSKKRSMDAIQAKVALDVRILMKELVRCFNPKNAKRVRAVLQFDFSDKDKNLHYRIELDRGTCKMTETESQDCDLRVLTKAEIWARIFTHSLNVREALMDKTLILEGDKSLFLRLTRFFPPPEQS